MSRETALAAARATKEPVRARTRATAAVKTTALAGVRKVGWTAPNTLGRSPFSARANNIRDALRMRPTLFPTMEIIEPAAIIRAPEEPMKRWAASARGVRE